MQSGCTTREQCPGVDALSAVRQNATDLMLMRGLKRKPDYENHADHGLVAEALR